MRANEIVLTGDMILEQAKPLAVSLDYNIFEGFLKKFKSRYDIEENPQPQVSKDSLEENDNCDEDDGGPVLDDRSSYEAIDKRSVYFARLGDLAYKLTMSKKVQSEITDYFK